MKEPVEVASKIAKCIQALEDRCAELDDVGEEKVNAEVEYDKEFEIALAMLADQEVPVTVRDKRAKGILAKNGHTERLKMAEIRYKALHTKIDAAKSALNGWQSYNRHLEIVAR
jgi:hypothetical protein